MTLVSHSNLTYRKVIWSHIVEKKLEIQEVKRILRDAEIG